jgi:microcystin degradation protein MlrC
MIKGLPYDLGRTCLLDVNGVLVAVVSVRHQTLSTDFLEQCGVNVADVASFTVKSRGHFRAGFDHLVADENIFEVDAPGLTTANLAKVEWRNLPRPVYPLDPDTEWGR